MTLHAEAARRLGRPLTPGETAIDLASADRALEAGKEELRAAIEAEKARAIRRLVRLDQAPRLEVTAAMLRALARLHVAGRDAALAETRKLLGEIPVLLAEPDVPAELAGPVAQLRAHLAGIGARIETSSDTVGLGRLAAGALERALVRRVPGALDAASRLVSGAYGDGLAAGFAPSLALFAGWVYSSIQDAARCTICAYYDGHRYDSWDAIQVVLPNGGPNPACHGDGRCRCRPVPVPPETPAAAAPPLGTVPETASDAADLLVNGIAETARRAGETTIEAELDAARKRFAARLKGRLSTDEALRARVALALARNATSSVHRAELSRHGDDVVVLLREGKKIDPVLDINDHFAAHRMTGNRSTILKEAAVNPKIVGSPAPGQATSSVSGGVEAILRHEYAHQSWAALDGDAKVAFGREIPARSDVRRDLSRYAATDPEEAWAELYAVVSDPGYDPAGWADWIVELGNRYFGSPLKP